jgi:hypothetical protein
LLNIFLGLSGRCHHAPAKASSSTPPRYLSTPPNENMKIRLWVLLYNNHSAHQDCGIVDNNLFTNFSGTIV